MAMMSHEVCRHNYSPINQMVHCHIKNWDNENDTSSDQNEVSSQVLRKTSQTGSLCGL